MIQKIVHDLSYVYLSAKFYNFFARLFILFYRSPMYETFRTESKNKQASEKVEKSRIKFRRLVNVAYDLGNRRCEKFPARKNFRIPWRKAFSEKSHYVCS